jgi:hypothetical protein
MLTAAGCSPWQTFRLKEYLERPDQIKEDAPFGIRVTTIYGDTYEGAVLKESDRDRLVMELHEPGSDAKWSGMVLSIPKDKVKAIQRYVLIY